VKDDCQRHRDQWLHAPAWSEHEVVCADCAAWTRVRVQHVAALSALTRPEAPEELTLRVQAELAGDRGRRLERALTSLTRPGAPAELEERVVELFGQRAPEGDGTRGEQHAPALGALDVHAAPPVLERLLSEELAAPAGHRVQRFSSSLERLSAPEALAQRLELGVRRRALARLVLAPLATLAAATLVVWLLVRRGGEHEYPFLVVRATAADRLDPLVRPLAEILGGVPPGEAR